LNHPDVYLDETNLRMCMNFRNNFARLANSLLDEGKKDSAVAVLDKCMEVFPESAVPYNYFVLPVAEAYYRAETFDKANAIISRLIDIFDAELGYYYSLEQAQQSRVDFDKQQALYILQRIMQITEQLKQTEMNNKVKPVFEYYFGLYSGMQTAGGTGR
jgi:tetratricopeptide (TPR) repeat protein